MAGIRYKGQIFSGTASFCDASDVAEKMLDLIYPVGSIYLSTANVSPATFIGGTWEALTGGYVLKTITTGTGGAENAATNTGGNSGNTSGTALTTSQNNDATSGTALTTSANNGDTSSVTLSADQSGLPAHGHGFTQPKIPNHVHSNTHAHGMGIDLVNANGTGTSIKTASGSSYGTAYSRPNTNNYTGNTGNPTSLPACTGGAVTNHSGAAATKGHSHKLGNHSHTIASHTHTLNNHSHTIASHTHTLNNHDHTPGMPANINVFAWKRTA